MSWHLMTNSQWVTLLYFFAKQFNHVLSHLWAACGWYCCFISLPGHLINHFSCHNQQRVSNTTSFPCAPPDYLMINLQVVSHLIKFSTKQCHCLPCHDQQSVSQTCYLCQSLIFISQPACESECISKAFIRQSLTIIPWWLATASEWYN